VRGLDEVRALDEVRLKYIQQAAMDMGGEEGRVGGGGAFMQRQFTSAK
jgi:hypothetical protein